MSRCGWASLEEEYHSGETKDHGVMTKIEHCWSGKAGGGSLRGEGVGERRGKEGKGREGKEKSC